MKNKVATKALRTLSLISLIMSVSVLAMDPGTGRKKHKQRQPQNTEKALTTAPLANGQAAEQVLQQLVPVTGPSIITHVPTQPSPRSYAGAAGAPEVEKKETSGDPASSAAQTNSMLATQKISLRPRAAALTNKAPDALTFEPTVQDAPASEKPATQEAPATQSPDSGPAAGPSDNTLAEDPFVIEDAPAAIKKELEPQYAPGTLDAEVEKSGTYFRMSSRAVREKALALVTTYDPEKNILGSGVPVENSRLFSTAITSWRKHHYPEDIQNCIQFLTVCQKKHITLDMTACEAARDFLNDIREQWEKEAKTTLTSQEAAAQKELAKQIEVIQNLYTQKQATLGELLTKEHERLLQIRTAIAIAASIFNGGVALNDKAPTIGEYASQPALLNHLGLETPMLLPDAPVQTLQTLAQNPRLKLKQE